MSAATPSLSFEPKPGAVLPTWAQRCTSAAIALHLAAVILAPLAVPPSSALFQTARGALGPYIDATFLNHGYHFFAPEPGPSHLLRYELEGPDGSRTEGTLPNRNAHWPRLLYHRHFMLSEQLLPLRPQALPGEPPPPKEAFRVYDTVLRSYAEHLLAQFPDAKAVSFRYREHAIASPLNVQRGQRLDDPSLYREEFLGRFERQAAGMR